jgi:hypothetical protein
MSSPSPSPSPPPSSPTKQQLITTFTTVYVSTLTQNQDKMLEEMIRVFNDAGLSDTGLHELRVDFSKATQDGLVDQVNRQKHVLLKILDIIKIMIERIEENKLLKGKKDRQRRVLVLLKSLKEQVLKIQKTQIPAMDIVMSKPNNREMLLGHEITDENLAKSAMLKEYKEPLLEPLNPLSEEVPNTKLEENEERQRRIREVIALCAGLLEAQEDEHGCMVEEKKE